MTHSSDSIDNRKNGYIIVLSSPSGGGKTSVLHEILKLHPEIEFSISVTTRQPRGAEQNGIDYRFASDEEFDDLVRNDAFVEWAVVHGFRYGTLKSTVQKALQLGKTIIMDTDTVGALNIKKLYPWAILIFIVPPSPDILFERLKNRHSESSDRLERRLSAIPNEIKQMKLYDYIVLNDTLDAAVEQVNAIIIAENLKSKKNIPIGDDDNPIPLVAFTNYSDRNKESLLNGTTIQETIKDNSSVKKIGRNQPCYCGSGKKYKKCCGANR